MGKFKYSDSIFINCPFDDRYTPILNALVFTIFDCGFIARCSLEEQDSSQIRIDKIYTIISDCKYGIHDISRTEPDSETRLPRFNMPLELGIFFGAKKFGINKQQKKKCLIIDTERYRYQQYISDIAGQDIEAHHNEPKEVIKIVRNWLSSVSGRTTIPGNRNIIKRYGEFNRYLPYLAYAAGLTDEDLFVIDLPFNDFAGLVSAWLKKSLISR